MAFSPLIKVAGMAVGRALFVVSSLFLLAGCLFSDVPAITEETAEDVGANFQYWVYSKRHVDDDGQREERDLIRFSRRSGKEYQLGLSNAAALGDTDPFANGMFIRKLGDRKGVPVYIVQFDFGRFELDPDFTPDEMGAQYAFYAVAVDSKGFGTAALIPCEDDGVISLSREHGIVVNCTRESEGGVPYIGEGPESAQIWEFLEALLRNDLFQWEDTLDEGFADSF